MNFNTQDLMIGLVAGVATAVLCLGVVTGSGLSLLLYLLSAVPIMVAGLGWGVVASSLGVLVAIGAVTLIANANVALVVAATTAVPAALAAHWLTLSRPAEELGGPAGHVAWFPLSDVIFRLGIIIAGAIIMIGIAIGYGPQIMEGRVDEMIASLQYANPDWQGFSAEGRAELVTMVTNLMPGFWPAFWLLVMTGCLYIALGITRASGQLRRPKDDWPSGLRMPRLALFVLAAGLLASALSGGWGHIGTAFAGPMLCGFMMAGYALFHDRSRGKSWRPLGMIVIYMGTLLTLLAALPFVIAGLLAASRPLPVQSTPSQPPKGGPTS